ncbi:hypothetical protein TRVL_09593 [Trypanosoma vivax]|nr:hypothetical protein TRVL_09593 [Trypanosoma vivax]
MYLLLDKCPFECSVNRKIARGTYISTYVDLDLAYYGLVRMTENVSFSTSLSKHLLGKSCCYLRLGTSFVVCGHIIDICSSGRSAKVTPDKESPFDLEWVDIDKLFRIPENLDEIRTCVASHVSKTITGSE